MVNILEEKTLKKIDTINGKFIELGFDFKEDLIELFETYPNIKERIENTKFKKIVFSKDEENNSYIMTLDDMQISFDIITMEEDDSLWYEVECHILNF